MANKEVQFKDGNDNIFPIIAQRTIASNTNLNDLNTFGFYKCENSTVSGTLTNKPNISSGFPMFVLPFSSIGAIQIIFGTTAIYLRSKSSSGWATTWRAVSLN